MQEAFSGHLCEMKAVTEKLIERYVRGLLTGEVLMAQLLRNEVDSANERGKLELLARNICIETLFEACSSTNEARQHQGLANLQAYLESKLAGTTGIVDLRADVVQLAMVEIWSALHLRGTGPDQPVAFLCWARVILFRQLSRSLKLANRSECLSLELQPEPTVETLPELHGLDPLDDFLQSEARSELKEAILALKNPQYRQVLLSTYFAGLEEEEMAARWQVQLKDIYLWRFRALKALRKQVTLARKLA